MKRVALTGPTGAVGRALIQYCIQNGVEVYAFCRKDSKRIEQIPQHSKVHIITCNLSELVDMTWEKEKCDVFFHLGWDATIGEGRNDIGLQLKNVQYTLDAVALAKRMGCTAFVGAGSQAEYGRCQEKLNGSVPAFPESAYGAAKLCAGQMSRMVCEREGIRHVWARILSVYGPGDNDKTLVMCTIQALLVGSRPEFTRGEQQWDYLYSMDAAKALYLLGAKGIHGKVYCVGSGKTRPLLEYILRIREQINPLAELGIGEIPYNPKQVMYLCADIKELIQDTGFYPEITFEEGIQRTINWMRNR